MTADGQAAWLSLQRLVLQGLWGINNRVRPTTRYRRSRGALASANVARNTAPEKLTSVRVALRCPRHVHRGGPGVPWCNRQLEDARCAGPTAPDADDRDQSPDLSQIRTVCGEGT